MRKYLTKCVRNDIIIMLILCGFYYFNLCYTINNKLHKCSNYAKNKLYQCSVLCLK